MNKRVLLAWICLLTLPFAGAARPVRGQAAQAAPAARAVLAASSFDAGAEGWTVAGDAAAAPVYHPTGGNPGGYISASDSADGETWYWVAPAKFLGDKAAAYGGALRYDRRQDLTDEPFPDVDVILEGAGLRLVHADTYAPGAAWTYFAVVLDVGGDWWKEAIGGEAPTPAEMQAVLADLTSLAIRGEFRTGEDTGDLDNVVLEAPRLPAWQMLPGTSAIYLAGRTDVTIPPVGEDPGATGFPLTRNCLGEDCASEDYLLERFPLAYRAPAGSQFTCRATGGVNYYNDPHGNIGPDGTPDVTSEIEPLGGISGYLGPAGSLVGVFLTDANPKDGTPPAPLPLNTERQTLTSALGQVFFIGDGLTGTGRGLQQVFTAPAGATRLFLGIADAGSFFGPPGMYDDNRGDFWVQADRYRAYLPQVRRR